MGKYRLSQATAGAENASKYALSSSALLTHGSLVASQAQKEAEDTADISSEAHNNGGFLGGIGYLGEKTAVGFMSSIEGIWDYAAGGLAKLFGADDWAEQQFANDWFGDWYSHPEEWYNPSRGWQVAGDVAGGIGTSLPAIAATVTGAAIAYLSGGTLSPATAHLISAGVAGLGAAGTSTRQAYRETGKLTGEEFGYGALSGVTEASLEEVSSVLGAGTGRIAESISKSFAKETTETIAKQTVVKTLAKDFLSEAFEEGVSELLDPTWQRMTYNEDAENASFQEVAYAAFVGGMSGIVMSGGNAAINSGTSFLKGNSLVGKGLDTEVIGLSRQLSEFEGANATGDETFQNIARTYDELSRSLAKTDGKVETVTQKKLLGDLHRANTVAVFKPMIAKSAANIVANAESVAQRLNEYGYKTADGKPITFTAAQIRKGVDTGERNAFAKALKDNSVLRTLAVADTTGHLVMDTARFKQATLMGKKLASQVDLNRFIETATQSEIKAVSQALNIENWATLDADTFNRKITEFVESGGVRLNADRHAMVQAIRSIPAETARPMLKMINLRQDGTVRYSDGTTQIAITRQGDAYTVYDYASNHLSKNMTRSEVNKLLRDYNIRQTDILADARAHKEAESELKRQTRELDTYARENISDYTKLSDPNQSMIRKIIREGRAKGMTDEDVLIYAKISAHAGIDITFDKQSTFIGYDEDGNEKYADGFYDPKNDRIVVNPESERGHERLLLHELEHIILKGKDGKKLIATAFKNIDKNTRSKVIKKYSEFYRGKGISVAEEIDILNDEVSAHFAEDVLSNRYILEKLIEAEPSLKEKILSFFKGASKDYESVPKLSRAAKRYYKTYKKLFDAFSERNFQNNATEAVLDVAETEKTPVTNTETDTVRVTGDDASELTRQDEITKKDYRYSIDTDLLEFVNSVNAMESKNAVSKRKYTLGKISESHAKIIENILSSELGLTIDAGEYTVNIDGSAVKHIEERHGVNGSSDHSMQNKADVARIGWAVNNAETGYIARTQTGRIDYSTQYRNADGSPSPKIMLEKYIGDGKFIVAECVPDTTSKKIHIISARKTKSGNGQVLNVKSNISSQPTSETLLDGITTTNSITDSSGNVNSNSENSSEKISNKRLTLKSDEGKASAVKNANTDTGRRYAIKYPNFSEADISSNMDAIADMEAVSVIDASKLEKTGRSPRTIFEEYFASIGNSIHSDVYGDISLGKSSAKSEIRHGITAEKIASIEAIPAVIEQGKVIFHKTKEGGVERIVVCAPIKIGETDYYMGIMLQRDAQTQYLYLHNVAIEKEAQFASEIHRLTTGITESDSRLFITSILQKALDVKADKQKSAKKPTGISSGISSAKRFASNTADSNYSYDALTKKGDLTVVELPTEIPQTDDGKVDKKAILARGKLNARKQKNQNNTDTDTYVRVDDIGLDVLLGTKGLQHGLVRSEETAFAVMKIGDILRESVAVNEMNGNASRKTDMSYVLLGACRDSDNLYVVRSVVSKLRNDVTEIDVYQLGAVKGKKTEIPNSALKRGAAVTEQSSLISSGSPVISIADLLENVKTIPLANEIFSKDVAKKLGIERSQGTLSGDVRYALSETDYKKQAEYWKAEHDKIKGRDRLLGQLMNQAQKMKDLKLGTFANSTQHDSAIFKNSIEQLARTQFRGNLNVSGTRKILSNLRQWYTSDAVKTGILGYVDANNTGLYVQGVTDMLETLSEGKKGFTKDDLKMLCDVMSYFTKFVENWGKVFRQGKWIEAKPEAERYINTLHANESLKVGLFGKMTGTLYMQTFGDPMTVARRMDRYESGFYTEMTTELRNAATDAQVAEMEVRSAYDDFTNQHKNYVKKASVETVTYRGTEISKMHLIGLYMTMKRKHAWAGLAANGFTFIDSNGKRVRVNGVISPDAKITNAELRQYTTEQLSAIEALLTDTDKEYVAILEQTFNVDARKLKADRDMQRLGFTNATDDYYYPIRRGNIAKNVDTADMASELDRVSNSSFNKDTVRGAKQELFIESADTVFNRHIHAVCQYAYLSPAVEAYNRLYNLDISGNPNKPISVATESANTWARGNKYFSKLIADIQGIPATSSEGMRVLGYIRGSYAKFQLGANPKVWITQLSSLFASSSLLDADSIMRGMTVSAQGIDEYCSLAKLRNYDSTATMAQGVLDSKTKRAVSAIGKFNDTLMIPIGKMDRFVVRRLFGACQVQVEKNGGAKIGTDANKIDAGKLLRQVILETQQNSIATERSAAMRSGNEVLRTFTMFTADSMKVIGRVIDSIGEASTIRAKLKITNDANARSLLKQQLKTANRKVRKSVGALTLSAVFMASVAQMFRWLYNKDQDEDESIAETMLVDAVGNLLGGLPLFKDAYSKIFEGYDVDNYAYSAINDLLDSALNVFEIAGNALTNEGSTQDRNRAVRNLAYSVGQLLGVPVRNVYNVLYGLTKRFNPEAAYVIDSALYKKNYQNELYKAIESDDAEKTSLIMSLLLGERLNDNVDGAVFNELLILSKNGQKVIPRSIPSSITIDGVEYPISAAEQTAIKNIYTTSEKSLKTLFAKSKYNSLSDGQKAEAIDYIYDTYYDKALEDTLGIDRNNSSLIIADVVGVDNLALLYVGTKGLTSDTDKRGNVISGSKRKKVVEAINSLGISTEKKLLLICAKGYSLQDNDIRGLSAAKAKKYLLWYILSLKGKTQAEKIKLAELCGFEVKNGRVVTRSVSSVG